MGVNDFEYYWSSGVCSGEFDNYYDCYSWGHGDGAGDIIFIGEGNGRGSGDGDGWGYGNLFL